MARSTRRIRRGARACAALTALALVVLGVGAATASALPARFWGVVPQVSPDSEQFQRLYRGGVRTARFAFDWGSTQPKRGGSYDWSSTDTVVETSVKNGIAVLPFLIGAPSWALPEVNVQGGHGAKAPVHLPVSGAAASGWRGFLQAAVNRYGPGGTFWAEHPELPSLPIRVWQIWNEPNFKYFVAKPNPAEYGKLVKASYAAVKSADPGAKVILAGMFARPKGARNPKTGKHKSINWYASDFLEQMYQRNPGIKAKFNGVSLHPYTIRYQDLSPEIEEFRGILSENHDAGKGLWVTELGWSSEPPNPAVDQFAKGVAGQARELRGAFKVLKAKQSRWKIQQVYWFSVDDLKGACNFCGGSGLFAEGFKPKKAWYEYVKFAGGRP
jgi:hypothetical protein